MPSSGQRVLIAANPKSGAASSRQRVAQLKAALSADGFQVEIFHSLEEVCRQSVAANEAGELRAVVSAGGDGTADALANLLPSQIPLLVFPLGTENLLARHLGITGDVSQACRIVQADRRVALDVGSANGKLFLVMLGCGFDAEVVRQMHAVRTGHINRWSYTRPIWDSLRRYRFPQLSYSVDEALDTPLKNTLDVIKPPADPVGTDQPIPTTAAAWLFVFNIPRYAASLNFCPQADPHDGLLDVCLFQRSGMLAGLGYLTRLWFGMHQRMRDFRHVRCRHLRVSAPRDANGEVLEVPFQIDGDPGGTLPLDIHVVPGRLTLLVPPT